ncbi:hypothetical protein [Changpingibacter yushuensis]|uniref:hypothetical protein n=1 Tax=Changpingibacter yushuensis TaxID=2758440 RepID=UPI00165E67B2|nr:hypothetical protein [Changpingibacter yushuensis]
MTGLALMAYAVLIVVAVVVVWMLTQRARRTHAFRQGNEALCAAVRSAKRRFFVAVGFTAVLLLVGFVTTLAFPAALGLPLAVTPSVAGVAGLLLYAAMPPPADSAAEGGVRVASLAPRHAWSFMSRRALVGLIALFAGTFVLLVVTGVTSSPDDAGRYRAITFWGDTFMSSATPYPGWFYAIPLLIALGLLALAAVLVLRRIATTPSLPGAGLEREDRAWRVVSTRVVTNLVSAAATLQLGGVAVFAGIAIRNAASQPGVPLALQAVGNALFVIGIAALAASIVWFTLAALRAFGLPHAVAFDVATQGDVREATGR